MKKVFYALLALLFVASCAPKNKVTIKGTLEGLNDGNIYLKIHENKQWIILDSCAVVNGKFTLAGIVTEPQIANLTYEADRLALLFVEPGTIEITGSVEMPKIAGTKSTDEYATYADSMSFFNETGDMLYEQYQEMVGKQDSVGAKNTFQLMDALEQEQFAFQKNYVETHPDSYVSLYVISSFLIHYADLLDLEHYKAVLSPTLNNTKTIKSIEERIDILKKVAIGQPAPSISLPDPEGNIRNLSDMHGTYVLIDFWASWCGPCRQENPHLVDAYLKFHERGFEIFAVSLDDSKERWMQAIEADHLSWTHVSELKKWNGEVSKAYGIMSIPSNVLIDPAGTIVARNLFNKELAEKLAEIYPEL